MTNIYNFLYRIAIYVSAFAVTGCSKEKANDLSLINLDDPYTYDNTPLGQRLADIYKKNGTYILYKNITPQDWTWNFDRSSGAQWRANGVDDAATNVPPALDYLEQYWFRFYSQSFLKQYLPFRIILSDSLVNGSTRFQFLKGEGMQAMSIRSALKPGTATAVTTRIQVWADSTKKRVSRDLHEQQYLETVGNKLATELPDSFFVWSSYDYTVSVSATSKNPKELGFWNLYQSTDKLSNISPSRGQDVADWLKKIIATKPQDMDGQFIFTLSGVQVTSEPLKRKYDILQRYLLQKYNMNFHVLNELYQ